MDAIDAENPDRVVLLGSLLYHGPRNDLPDDYAPKKVIAIRGSCEAEVDQMSSSHPGVTVFNPGSVGIPKDGTHSYGLYEGGRFEFRMWDE